MITCTGYVYLTDTKNIFLVNLTNGTKNTKMNMSIIKRKTANKTLHHKNY